MNRLCINLCLVFCASIVGCAKFDQWTHFGKVGPNYQPPGACIADGWIENGPYFIAAQHAVQDDCWWEALGDPWLSDLVEQARASNLTLNQAYLRMQAQQLRRNIVVGNLFPQSQTAIAEYQRIQFSENGNLIGIPGLGDSFDLYRVGFNASWEVDLWGRLRRQVESAEAEVGASIEDMHDVELSLVAEVATTYTQIRVLQERIRIAQDQVRAQAETQRIAQMRLEVGTGTELDVSQALATVEATKAAIPELQASLRQANNDLCVLLGMPPTLLFDENNAAPIPTLPMQVVVGMPRDLLRRRPDIRSAEREVAAQSALIGVATADLLPAFTLRGTIDWQAFEFPDLFDGGSLGGAIIPGFQWNILNYGRIKNNISLQETLLLAKAQEYRQTVLNANSEVENALIAYAKKHEELEKLRSAIRATERSLELAETQYSEGDTDLDRVNNLRKELIARLNAEAVVEGQAAVYLIRVYRTLGGGWRLSPESSTVATAPVKTNPYLPPAAPTEHFQHVPTPQYFEMVPQGQQVPQIQPEQNYPPQTFTPISFSQPPAHGNAAPHVPIASTAQAPTAAAKQQPRQTAAMMHGAGHVPAAEYFRSATQSPTGIGASQAFRLHASNSQQQARSAQPSSTAAFSAARSQPRMQPLPQNGAVFRTASHSTNLP